MIAVTGANGFVGKAVCDAMTSHGLQVRRLARNPSGGTVGIGDIGPGTDWTAAVSGCQSIVHLAARVHVMQGGAADDLDAFRRINVAGTRALAEQAAALGVKRLVFVSSIKVNGEATETGHPFRSADRPMPVDAYGRSKREAEDALRDIARRTGLAVAIIRPPLVYGPGVRANFRTMVRAVASGITLPFGAVRNKRSLIAVDNLADLIRVCLEHPNAPGEPLLASDGDDLSTPELVRALATSLGRPARLVAVPPRLLRAAASLAGRRGAIDRLTQSLQIDAKETQGRLGWRPPFTLEESFAKAGSMGWANAALPGPR